MMIDDSLIEMVEKVSYMILARVPGLADMAATVRTAARKRSPILLTRFRQMVDYALIDVKTSPEGDFTDSEKRQIGEAMIALSSARSDISYKSEVVRLRVTVAEKTELKRAADDDLKTLSEYIRDKIF